MGQDVFKAISANEFNKPSSAVVISPSGSILAITQPGGEITDFNSQTGLYQDRFDDRVCYSSSGLPE